MSGSVLVTGGAGFIGSHIAEAYLAAGWTVTCVDDLSRGKRHQVPAGATFVEGDIRSEAVRTLLATGGFDVLNHQAAQIDVRISVEDPAADASINLVGFANLLAGAAKGGVRRVVFASSGGVVYGDPDVIPTPEPTATLPISPYGVSKLASEHYLRALGELGGFEGVALRYSNVYGPRQDPHGEAGVVAIFSNRLLAGTDITVFGDGEQTRDYVHVGDVARANLLVSEAPLRRGGSLDDVAFNVGTGIETSVNRLAELLIEASGRTSALHHAEARPGELRHSSLDASRLRALGWRPAMTLQTGLKDTFDWIAARSGAVAPASA